MIIPLATLIFIAIVVIASATALAVFVWAIQAKQFSSQQMKEGASSVFDQEEPEGCAQDLIFKSK
jgi:nitrogen fixation-related uncharacterized protein